jgi:alpha-L-rhamnosidase
MFEFQIPPNTTALVRLPARQAAPVRESGGPAAQAAAVRLLRVEPDAAEFEIASGQYRFAVDAIPPGGPPVR